MPRLAVDTNVLLRALTDDGSDQSSKARKIFRDEAVFVGSTVLLETEWVLRSRYRMSGGEVNALFSALLVRPNVLFDDEAAMREAVSAHRDGMDFADAVHLFLAADCEAFLTFDEDFRRSSRRLSSAPPVRRP